jgi:hypothetical protein
LGFATQRITDSTIQYQPDKLLMDHHRPSVSCIRPDPFQIYYYVSTLTEYRLSSNTCHPKWFREVVRPSPDHTDVVYYSMATSPQSAFFGPLRLILKHLYRRLAVTYSQHCSCGLRIPNLYRPSEDSQHLRPPSNSSASKKLIRNNICVLISFYK